MAFEQICRRHLDRFQPRLGGERVPAAGEYIHRQFVADDYRSVTTLYHSGQYEVSIAVMDQDRAKMTADALGVGDIVDPASSKEHWLFMFRRSRQ